MEPASRQERRLVRQRGAGTRELKGVEFGFSFGAIGTSRSPAIHEVSSKNDALLPTSLHSAAADVDVRKSRGKKQPISKRKASETDKKQPQRRAKPRTGSVRGLKKATEADEQDEIQAAAPLTRASRPSRNRKAVQPLSEDIHAEQSSLPKPKQKSLAKRGRPKKRLPEEDGSQAMEDAVHLPPQEPMKPPRLTNSKASQVDALSPVDRPRQTPRVSTTSAELEIDDFKDAVEFQSLRNEFKTLATNELPASESSTAPSRIQRGRRQMSVSSKVTDAEQPRRKRRRAGSPDPALIKGEKTLGEGVLRDAKHQTNDSSLIKELPLHKRRKRTPQPKPSAPKKKTAFAAVPEEEPCVFAEATSVSHRSTDSSRAVQKSKPKRADQHEETQTASDEPHNPSKLSPNSRNVRQKTRSTTLFANTRQYPRSGGRSAEEPGDLASILRRYGEPKIPAKLTTNADSRLNFRF